MQYFKGEMGVAEGTKLQPVLTEYKDVSLVNRG